MLFATWVGPKHNIYCCQLCNSNGPYQRYFERKKNRVFGQGPAARICYASASPIPGKGTISSGSPLNRTVFFIWPISATELLLESAVH